MSRPNRGVNRYLDINGFPYGLLDRPYAIGHDGSIGWNMIYPSRIRKKLCVVVEKNGWAEKRASGHWYLTEAGKSYVLLMKV